MSRRRCSLFVHKSCCMIRWALFLFVILTGAQAFGQDNPAETKQLAKELITYDRYEEALTILRNSRELRLYDEEGRFLMALCHYQLNQLDEAESLLKELSDNPRGVFPAVWLYLGKVFHARHQFGEAAQYYKTYLRNIGRDDPARPMIMDELRRCANGLQLQYRSGDAFVENLGPAINTPYDEFGIVPSANFADRIYFSSRRPGNIGGLRNIYGQTDERFGRYYSDIFSAQNQQNVWGNVQPLHYLLNSPRHEMILDFNESGSVMYYYHGNDWSGGMVMVDTFRQEENRILSSDPFLGPVEPTVEQAAPHFIDSRTLIFPSRRPGGYGGFDLYISVKNNDGQWSEPKNLGPTINSAYDETTPFLARDGRTLYFSSNNRDRSIGGYDVFRSLYLAETDRWLLPENLGLPINSAGDDTHFRLSNDGNSAFLTSSRKDGFGQRDLYIVYFNDFREEQEPPETLAGTYYQQFRKAAPVSPSRAEDAPRVVDLPPDPIPFNSQVDFFSPTHRPQLDRLAEMLLKDPSRRLLITVFTNHGSSVSESLYWAVQEASPLIDFLISRGISPSSIALHGELAELNDFGIAERAVATFDLSGPAGHALAGARGGSPQAVIHPLSYRLQIATMRGAFTGNFMDALPEPFVEKGIPQPICHYLTGRFPTFADADEQRRVLAAQGIIGQVIPYIDGWRATEQEIRQNLNRLPDLNSYLAR